MTVLLMPPSESRCVRRARGISLKTVFIQQILNFIASHSFHRSRNRQASGFAYQPFISPTLTGSQWYLCRSQVARFFKWTKKCPQIKEFFVTLESIGKTKICTAMSGDGLLPIFNNGTTCQSTPARFYRYLVLLSSRNVRQQWHIKFVHSKFFRSVGACRSFTLRKKPCSNGLLVV